MKLLISGGTQFLGRHLVTAALERTHEVTLFNRGTRRPFADVETVVDRGTVGFALTRCQDQPHWQGKR